jgi:hypothetical protein
LFREKFEAALGTYQSGSDVVYRNGEIARTSYYLSVVLQKQGNEEESKTFFQDAEKLRKEILGDGYFDSTDEEAYDQLVSLWAR